ncbi:MAG: cytoplasmic protein [Deltaproteobacteria bacterium]|nr:cytoplasmic protein [Deltaproteobacteria bacterium]
MVGRIPPNALRKKQNQQSQFNQFEATELFCPTCQRSMPVRKRLLLVLPSGDKYEYLCARCGTSVGDKIDKGTADQNRLII